MASLPPGAVASSLGRIFGAGTVAGLTEGQLLDRFHDRRDELAFEALVARFGPMVLAVCRGLLRDPHDVDDAFQATFLVLVKKGRTLRDPARLGPWLHGVAHRVAAKARVQAARRVAREGARAHSDVPAPPGSTLAPDDLRPLHEELDRLPNRYREPVVLCHLQGLSCEEAARHLNCPVGTVKGRLSRARHLLHDRLVRRGVTLSGGLAVLALTRQARAKVPELLIHQTVKTAAIVAAGRAFVAGTVPASAAALAEGMLKTMAITQLKLAAGALVSLGVVLTGAGLAARGQEPGGTPATEPKTESTTEKVDSPPAEVKKAEAPPPYSGPPRNLAEYRKQQEEAFRAGRLSPDPGSNGTGKADSELPLGPESIVGIDSLGERRLRAAIAFLKASREFYYEGTITIDRGISASQRLMETQADLARDDATRRLAAQAHVDRMRQLRDRERSKYDVGMGSLPNLAEAELALTEAEYHLAHLGQTPPTSPKPAANPESTRAGGAAYGIPNDDHPRSGVILARLDLPVSMPFHDETPLEDLIKYLKGATESDDLPQGLPIYVDPAGLDVAEKTLQSPITLELEGVPLRRTLYLALRQLGLAYAVQDGLLIVSTPDRLDEILLDNPVYVPSERSRLEFLMQFGDLSPQAVERLKQLREAEEGEAKRQRTLNNPGRGAGFQ